MIFAIKIHWKGFYDKNALEIILHKMIFIIRMHWKRFLP